MEKLAPGSLVRYRGMVQDMLNPEFFLGVYQEKLSSGETVTLSILTILTPIQPDSPSGK